MTHLEPQEVIDALDGTLDAGRAAHLDACAECRREVDAYSAVIAETALEKRVPEPSPLFWEHFSRRVRAATDGTTPSRRAHWLLGWKSLTSLGMVAASLVLIATLRSGSGPASTPPTLTDVTPADDVSVGAIAELLTTELEPWAVVADAAAELSAADLGEMSAPAPGSAERLVESLSEDERAELARLLQAAIEGGSQ